MSERKYYWLKLQSDFLRQNDIKKMRNIDGGAIYIIIYLKIMLLFEMEKGCVIWGEEECRIEEELASEIDESIEDVSMTLMFLKNHGLVKEISSDEFASLRSQAEIPFEEVVKRGGSQMDKNSD